MAAFWAWRDLGFTSPGMWEARQSAEQRRAI